MPKPHAAKPNAHLQLRARWEEYTHTHTLRCWQRQSDYQPRSIGYRACGIALIVGNHFTSWKNWLWVSACVRPWALLSHLVWVWLYFQVCFERDTLCPACVCMRVFWGAEELRQQQMDVQYLLSRNQESKILLERRDFWTMNHSLLLHDTKGLNVLRQDFLLRYHFIFNQSETDIPDLYANV